jgi:hypothetical protein
MPFQMATYRGNYKNLRGAGEVLDLNPGCLFLVKIFGGPFRPMIKTVGSLLGVASVVVLIQVSSSFPEAAPVVFV